MRTKLDFSGWKAQLPLSEHSKGILAQMIDTMIKRAIYNELGQHEPPQGTRSRSTTETIRSNFRGVK